LIISYLACKQIDFKKNKKEGLFEKSPLKAEKAYFAILQPPEHLRFDKRGSSICQPAL